MDVKKGIHHIKNTRPKWYKNYHEWEHHATLHWISFAASSAIIIMGFANIVIQLTQTANVKDASAATTTMTQAVNAGSLTITSGGAQSLSAASVSINSQNTTGSLGTITVTDNRGTGVGWTATATSSHFVKANSAVKVTGSNDTVTTNSSSTYSSATGGTYTITINTGGAVGVATFDVTGLETASGVSTGSGSGIDIGTRGIKADFGAATYVNGDSWTIRADIIPVTGFSVTPGSVTTISGSSTNVTAGSLHTWTTTSDATTLISASSGYGMGSYSVAPSLELTVPANSYANSYTATVTETIN